MATFGTNRTISHRKSNLRFPANAMCDVRCAVTIIGIERVHRSLSIPFVQSSRRSCPSNTEKNENSIQFLHPFARHTIAEVAACSSRPSLFLINSIFDIIIYPFGHLDRRILKMKWAALPHPHLHPHPHRKRKNTSVNTKSTTAEKQKQRQPQQRQRINQLKN